MAGRPRESARFYLLMPSLLSSVLLLPALFLLSSAPTLLLICSWSASDLVLLPSPAVNFRWEACLKSLTFFQKMILKFQSECFERMVHSDEDVVFSTLTEIECEKSMNKNCSVFAFSYLIKLYILSSACCFSVCVTIKFISLSQYYHAINQSIYQLHIMRSINLSTSGVPCDRSTHLQ